MLPRAESDGAPGERRSDARQGGCGRRRNDERFDAQTVVNQRTDDSPQHESELKEDVGCPAPAVLAI